MVPLLTSFTLLLEDTLNADIYCTGYVLLKRARLLANFCMTHVIMIVSRKIQVPQFGIFRILRYMQARARSSPGFDSPSTDASGCAGIHAPFPGERAEWRRFLPHPSGSHDVCHAWPLGLGAWYIKLRSFHFIFPSSPLYPW